MRLSELDKIITETQSEDWEVIANLPTFLYGIMQGGDRPNEPPIVGVEQHDMVAVFRADIDIRIAWGYDPSFRMSRGGFLARPRLSGRRDRHHQSVEWAIFNDKEIPNSTVEPMRCWPRPVEKRRAIRADEGAISRTLCNDRAVSYWQRPNLDAECSVVS